MAESDRGATEAGMPPAECGLVKKSVRAAVIHPQTQQPASDKGAVIHQKKGWQQPQPDDGKTRRPPLAHEGSISRVSVVEQLRRLSAEHDKR
jgi:hypothetical protein